MEQTTGVITGVAELKKKIENQCYMILELEIARPSLKVTLTVHSYSVTS